MKYLYGVSPAFLLSLYGNDFVPEQVADAAGTIKELGFDCFQCEIVKEDKLRLWLNGGAKKVFHAAVQNGLKMSQFVAHLMMEYYGNRELVCSEQGLDEIKQVVEICDIMQFKGQITVPVGPFEGISELSAEEHKFYTEKLAEKFRVYHECITNAGNKMAIEVQPGSLISGLENIKNFINSVSPDTGYNFDTGHAWASGDRNLQEFPKIFGRKIYGTHLCDNDGVVNDSLCPGEGTIPWEDVIRNLEQSGYSGSMDLEIFTKPENVKAKYGKGLEYIKSLLLRNPE